MDDAITLDALYEVDRGRWLSLVRQRAALCRRLVRRRPRPGGFPFASEIRWHWEIDFARSSPKARIHWTYAVNREFRRLNTLSILEVMALVAQ